MNKLGFFFFLSVMASAVKSLPVILNISEQKPAEYSKAEYHLETQRQPRADVYPLFFDKAKKPLVTNVGHTLFPKNFYKFSTPKVVEGSAKTSEKTTKSVGKKINTRSPIPFDLQFYPKAQNDGATDKNSNNTGGSAIGNPSNLIGQRKLPKELTISLPRFKTDAQGKWVYNPWGVTYQSVWKLTKQDHYYWLWDFRSQGLYKTQTPHPTVCFGKSTVYNVPPVMNWLLKRNRRGSIGPKPLLLDLRMEIYLQGKSETCHTNQYLESRPYLECALLRNMRMEYLMPHYPLHQTGNKYYDWFRDDYED